MIQFTLPNPIPYFNTPLVKGQFKLHYPDGFCYWQLMTESGQKVLEGNATFPTDLLEKEWTTSDEPLIQHLLSQAPWEPKPAAAPAEQPNTENSGEINTI